MKRAAANLRSAFQSDILTLPLSSIVSQKSTTAEVVGSSIFKQILASVREIGLIEPLVLRHSARVSHFYSPEVTRGGNRIWRGKDIYGVAPLAETNR
jgi:hypothetical protein